MAGTAGTGTTGANQDGSNPIDARTPGEVLIVGQPASYSSEDGPNVSLDLQLAFVQTAFDTAVKEPLRNRLIWDQFATKKPSGVPVGGPVRVFFGEDIDEAGATTPLLENLDVDSVDFSVKSMDLSPLEYGRAVSRTRLANARTMINIDPMIVDRVAFDAARAADLLAKGAFVTGCASGIRYNGADGTPLAANGTVSKMLGSGAAGAAAATDFLGTTQLQVAISALEQVNAMPFMSGNFVLLTNPVGAQHLKNERNTGGFRYVTSRNEGAAGNSIYRGQIGMIEGADIVVSNTVPAGKAYLIATDALAKVYSTREGYGEQPVTVVAPVIDKMRRFLSWGWLHYVGYKVFDVRSIVEITISSDYRPDGTGNASTLPAEVVPAVFPAP